MEQFTDLMAESPFVKRQKKISEEEGIKKGIEKGKKEGLIEASRNDALSIVRLRFPQFTELAQQKVSKITRMQALNDLHNKLVIAADDQAVRLILESLEG